MNTDSLQQANGLTMTLPMLMDLIKNLKSLSIKNDIDSNIQNDNLKEDSTLIQLNEKLQLILSMIQVQELEHLYPNGIKRKMAALSRCSIDFNSPHEDLLEIMKKTIRIGNRAAFELLIKNSDSQKIISSLWIAARKRGCQFIGPGPQEEVLKLIVLALGDGAMLTRKVLVLYILQKLQISYPLQATKTSVGHVVQILYRASCFELINREGESCLMQLKEPYRNYEKLRREHDAQIISIAIESGIRLSPEQWSSLLYGDARHTSQMQSILAKLNAKDAPFDQLVNQLEKTLSDGEDPTRLIETIPHLRQLVLFEQNIEDESTCCYSNINIAVDSVILITTKMIIFINYVFNKNGTYSLYKNPFKNHLI